MINTKTIQTLVATLIASAFLCLSTSATDDVWSFTLRGKDQNGTLVEKYDNVQVSKNEEDRIVVKVQGGDVDRFKDMTRLLLDQEVELSLSLAITSHVVIKGVDSDGKFVWGGRKAVEVGPGVIPEILEQYKKQMNEAP